MAQRKKDSSSIKTLPLKAQGRTLLLVFVAAHGNILDEKGSTDKRSFNLLALFQTSPSPQLLDLVDLGYAERFYGFWWEQPLIDLTPTTQACLTYQSHHNSSQGYLTLNLFWVRKQRLERILRVDPFNSQAPCMAYTTKVDFRTQPDKGRQFPQVVAKLTLKGERNPSGNPECPKPWGNFTRSYRGVWRWNPASQKYGQNSGNLNELYNFYRKVN